MMPTAEHGAIAAEIADALGEHGSEGQAPRARVEQQIAGMVALMGEAWVRSILPVSDTPPTRDRVDGLPRTQGGRFFKAAQLCAGAAVQLGNIASRQFFSTFCWREPQPKAPRAPRTKQEKQPQAVAPKRERGKGGVTEVYVRRRKP